MSWQKISTCDVYEIRLYAQTKLGKWVGNENLLQKRWALYETKRIKKKIFNFIFNKK